MWASVIFAISLSISMKLIIDIGNTLTKLAVFENRGIVFLETTRDLSPTNINNFLEKFPEIRSSIISNVRPYDKGISD